MAINDDFENLFAKKHTPEKAELETDQTSPSPSIWKLLVVDDEADVHTITKLALKDFEFENHTLKILSAFSTSEAKEVIQQNPDIAMVFLDVVMETNDAGFDLVNHIRKDLKNKNIRIALRTGQPGDTTEQEALRHYGIDDYKTKTELTSDKLSSTVMSCLKTYNTLIKKEAQQQKLEQTVEEKNAELQTMNADLVDEIKKREKTEIELKASEQRFRMLYENLDVTLKSITDGVIRTDKTGEVILMNRMAENLTGWKFKDVGTTNINEIFNISHNPKSNPEATSTNSPGPSPMQKAESSEAVPPKNNRAGSASFDVIPDSTLDTEYHTVLTSKNGSRKIIEYSSAPIKNNIDTIIGKVIIFRDITERIQLESQLAHAQRMEALGVLAGGIAHDFNNILASILGFTELLLYDAEKDSELEDSLKEIFTAGTRAKELVQQILAFARHSRHSLQPVQANLIAKETLKLIRSSIPSTIAIDSSIKSTSLVMADPTQIHQIFMNLFTNAAHAMDEHGGTLTVRMVDENISAATKGKPIALQPGEYIKITVADTGTGIPPEIIHSVFEPYFTTKKYGEGTGMGLALVHGIVESCKGSITVKSSMGKGTVFTLYIPITDGSSISESKYIENMLHTGNENILLVDDEVAIGKVGKLLLEKSGYRVTATTSSTDALEIFNSTPKAFDLVITDMTMPNMTGDLLTKKMRQIRPDLPVILYTGYSKKISQEEALSKGFNGYITKPFNKKELIKTVKSVLKSTSINSTLLS